MIANNRKKKPKVNQQQQQLKELCYVQQFCFFPSASLHHTFGLNINLRFNGVIGMRSVKCINAYTGPCHDVEICDIKTDKCIVVYTRAYK